MKKQPPRDKSMADNRKKGAFAELERRRNSTERKSIVPQKKKNLKRAIKIVILVFVILGILCFVLEKAESCTRKEFEEKLYGELKFNPDGIVSVDYYEPDYNADIFSEKDYLNKNRVIRYVDGNISIVLDEYEDDELDAGQRFFKKYFNAVVNGDYDSYRSMIADDCEANPKIYGDNLSNKKFPMQRLYNISVKKLAFSDDANNVYNGKQALFGVYEVSYCIQKNDGEFRLGLPSDKVIPVIYQTATTGAGTSFEKTVITKIYLYEDIASNDKENDAE